MQLNYKKSLAGILLCSLLFMQNAIAIEDTQNTHEHTNHQHKSKFSLFKKNANDEVTLTDLEKRIKKIKKTCGVVEIHLPQVLEFGVRPTNVTVMSIDDCVQYALKHSHELAASEDTVCATESGIGKARSNYFPKIGAEVNYNHNTARTNAGSSHLNSVGFNVGISEMIWDFGRTTAKINMAEYDTLAKHYDHEFEELAVIYAVKICYYKVLMALANLDIYEQNVRINTLNYTRTKAMFDEGLKSKIDVVNAQVNLTDAKVQLVEGQKDLEDSIIALKESMDYEEPSEFIVKNTENFGFLKADYKKKMEDLDKTQPVNYKAKKNGEGLITLSSGIEHNDIIKNFKFSPYSITKQESINKAFDLRPDLKSSRMTQSVQEESLKAIKRQYTPQITGNVNWGYDRYESGIYSSPLSVGAGISFGEVNPYGIHYQIQEGEAYLDIAKHNVNIALCDIYYEVQTNYVDMRQLERKIPLMRDKVKATLENFELADGRYSVGLSNYVELQDALTNYNKSQLNYVDAVFKYNVARETLLKSMGVK